MSMRFTAALLPPLSFFQAFGDFSTQAQQDGPIRFVVPYPAGGAADQVAA